MDPTAELENTAPTNRDCLATELEENATSKDLSNSPENVDLSGPMNKLPTISNFTKKLPHIDSNECRQQKENSKDTNKNKGPNDTTEVFSGVAKAAPRDPSACFETDSMKMIKQLQEKLATNERDYCSRIYGLSEVNNRLKKLLSNSEKEIEEWKIKVKEFQSVANQELQRAIGKYTNEISNYQSELILERSQSNKIMLELEGKEETITILRQRVSEFEERQKTLEEEIKIEKEATNSLRKEVVCSLAEKQEAIRSHESEIERMNLRNAQLLDKAQANSALDVAKEKKRLRNGIQSLRKSLADMQTSPLEYCPKRIIAATVESLDLVQQCVEEEGASLNSVDGKFKSCTAPVNEGTPVQRKRRKGMPSEIEHLKRSASGLESLLKNKSSMLVEKIVASSNKMKEKKKVCILFSGFKPKSEKYSLGFKKNLINMAKKLGVEVKLENELEDAVSHVVAPPGCTTMKTLAASLTGRWIMRPEWIKLSKNEGNLLDEGAFGFISSYSPFSGKKVCLSEAFLKENSEKHFKLDNCRLLVETLGKGSLCSEIDNADYILCTDSEASAETAEERKKRGKVYWDEFLKLIPQPPEES
eukprot:Nk52_evm82s223 gene=Nk52_evmTU82s223